MELAEQVDNIVGLATAARARGDHQAALTQFSAARDLAPHNAWLHLDVATALRALGRLDEAEASCRQILTFQPEFAAAHRTLGVIARDRKDHQAALACFEMARQFGPSDQWTAFEIANEYLTLERYDEAIAQYNATLALKPDFPEPHRQIGIIQRGRGDHQAALAQFSAARDLAPQNAWFHLDVVTELRVLGRLDEAESSCRQILTFQPEFAAAHRTLGVIARDRKDHQAALACFEVARQYGPTDPWTSFEIANEYRTLGRHDDAIAQYNATLALKPDFPEPHRQIAMIQRARGDHQAALAQFSAARDLAPHNAWFYLDVATELRALGRLDEADASCRQILTFQPEFVAAHRTLGMIARARKDHQAALACFEVARQYGPTDHWTTFEIANEYRTLERYDEAVAQYYATLALKPDFPEPHRQIGIIERVRKNHEAALAQFSAARDLAPHNAWFHLDVAAELRVLGRLDEAEASCRQILTFQPEFAPAYRTLGMIARDRKDHQAALAYFELARQYGPTDHWTAFEIANEYRTLERYDEAIAHYYATLAIKPDFPEPHRQIGTIERMRGNEAAAIGHFEVALFHLERAATNADGRAVFAPVEVLLLLERLPEAEDRLLKLEGVISDADLLAETHALRAQICGKKRDFVSEVSHRREVARLRPDSTAAWHVLIEKQIALNMPGPALADITEALIHIPDEPDLLIERARALRIAGRTDEAAMQLRDISLDQHTSALTYTRLANEFRSAGMYDEARISAEAAIRVAPHFSWAHLSLAFTILEHDGPIAGLAQFDRELERSPNNQEAIYQVSRLLRENGDAARARDFLIERGETVMSPLRIFEELIVCLCQCDEFDRARALVARREQLALAGDDLLGPAIEIELSSGDTRKLAALVSKAQDSSAHNPAVLSRIIRGAHVLSDMETVIRTNQAWIERDPARALHGELGIAEAEFRLGRQDRAMKILGSLKQRFGDFQDLYAMTARLFRSAGKLRATAATLQLGLRKFPNYAVLWEQYVRLCIQTNQIGTARELLAAMDGSNYMMAAERDLLEIELDLELRDIENSLRKIERFNPRLLNHRTRYHALCLRACLAALDLPSARMHLSSEIAISRFDRKLRRQSRNVSQSLMGQILDEYRLDQDNVQELIAINKLPSSERLDRFFKRARLDPGSTATAITTLIHLRHTGAFSLPEENGPSGIPTRIAQFWDSNDVPSDIAKYMESWRSNNDGWQHELFNSSQAADFIRSTCPPEILTAFYRSPDATTKADLFRLAWLSHRGGFYVDADDVSTGPIQDILAPGTRLVAHQEDIGSIGNNFVGAVAGHPIIATALREATDSILRGDRDMVWLSTGPGMFSRVFMEWLVAEPENPQVARDEIIILDRGELAKVCAAHCQAAYKLTPLHWTKGMFG